MDRPKVWVWVIVCKDWKILLWKRKNSHWDWFWSFPWWHLEFNEWIIDCALREVKEEVWISIGNLKVYDWFTNDFFEKEKKHYITLYVICDYVGGRVEVLESEKCEKWDWFKWGNFPDKIFLPIKNLKNKWFEFSKLLN